MVLRVIDWDKDGSHDLIGTVETNIASLLKSTGQEIGLTGSTKTGKTKNTGYLIFQSVDPAPSSLPAQALRIKFSAKGLPRMDKLGLGKSGEEVPL